MCMYRVIKWYDQSAIKTLSLLPFSVSGGWAGRCRTGYVPCKQVQLYPVAQYTPEVDLTPDKS